MRLETISLDLGQGVRFVVDAHEQEVGTLYPDGAYQPARRDDTHDNRMEARDQGYHGDGAVWRSLVQHEALHSLVARAIYGRESRVLRFLCGAEPDVTYAERLHEEAVVLALQHHAQRGVTLPALGPYVALAPKIIDQLDALELP